MKAKQMSEIIKSSTSKQDITLPSTVTYPITIKHFDRNNTGEPITINQPADYEGVNSVLCVLQPNETVTLYPVIQLEACKTCGHVKETSYWSLNER